MSLLQSEISTNTDPDPKELLAFLNLSEFESTYHKKKLNEYFMLMNNDFNNENNAELTFKIGLTCFALGKYILANEYLEESINYCPRLVYYILGVSNFNKGKYFEKSGNFRAVKNNYDKSIFYYKKALEEEGSQPSNLMIYFDLGAVFNELEDYYQLTDILHHILKEKPDAISSKLYKNYHKSIHDLKSLVS